MSVVAALLRDIGDALSPENHSAVSAAVIAPYVAEYTAPVVAHHGVFKGYYYFDKVGLDARARPRAHIASANGLSPRLNPLTQISQKGVNGAQGLVFCQEGRVSDTRHERTIKTKHPILHLIEGLCGQNV